MRYRLQRKETVFKPCTIGNHSMPLRTYCWKDLAVSDNLNDVVEYATYWGLKKRIPDCRYQKWRQRDCLLTEGVKLYQRKGKSH